MGLFNRLLGRAAPSSKDIAKERLQIALVNDRLKIPPEVLETVKQEMTVVVSQYMLVDKPGIEVTLTTEHDHKNLVASIPVRGLRRRKSR
jgi:cell division topological specificity factor